LNGERDFSLRVWPIWWKLLVGFLLQETSEREAEGEIGGKIGSLARKTERERESLWENKCSCRRSFRVTLALGLSGRSRLSCGEREETVFGAQQQLGGIQIQIQTLVIEIEIGIETEMKTRMGSVSDIGQWMMRSP